MHFAISPRRRGQGRGIFAAAAGRERKLIAALLRWRAEKTERPHSTTPASTSRGVFFYRAPLWCLRALTQLRAGFGNPLTGLRQQPIFYRVGNT
jgi:hypothetical protein